MSIELVNQNAVWIAWLIIGITWGCVITSTLYRGLVMYVMGFFLLPVITVTLGLFVTYSFAFLIDITHGALK